MTRYKIMRSYANKQLRATLIKQNDEYFDVCTKLHLAEENVKKFSWSYSCSQENYIKATEEIKDLKAKIKKQEVLIATLGAWFLIVSLLLVSLGLYILIGGHRP